MEFLLLVFGLLGLLVHNDFLQGLLLLLVIAGSTWIARQLLPKQPLCALFIVAYIGMYLLNPLGIVAGFVRLEPLREPSIFYRSNGLLMIGIALFAVGAKRLRTHRLDVARMPSLYLPGFATQVITMVILSGCLVAICALIVVAGADVNIFTVEKSYRSTGNETGLFLLTTYAMTILPLAIFLVGCSRYTLQLMYAGPILLILTLHFMVYRVRVLAVACLVAYLTSFIVRRYLVVIGNIELKREITWLRRAVLVVSIPLLAFSTLAIRYLRQSYSNPRFGYTLDREHLNYLIEGTFAGGDLGYAFWLRQAISNFPSRHEYLLGYSYYRLAFVPIPRFVWPDKPESTQRIFAQVVDANAASIGLTIPPGIVGDLYINFGSFGVVGMVLFGAFFAMERYRTLNHLLFVAGSGYWIFYLVRGSSTTPIVILVTIWFAGRVFSRLIRPVPIQRPVTAEAAMTRYPPIASGVSR